MSATSSIFRFRSSPVGEAIDFVGVLEEDDEEKMPLEEGEARLTGFARPAESALGL